MSRRALAAVALVVSALAAAGACTGEEGPSTGDTRATGTTISLDPSGTGALDYPAYRDPGTPIVVALGRRFALQLAGEPGAGFRWQVANTPDPAVVVPLGTQFRSENPGIPGSPALQYMSFAASGVGNTTIEVRLVSPGGELAPDSFPLVFDVTVTFTGEPPPPPPETDTTIALDE
jgi:hypothetical protein